MPTSFADTTRALERQRLGWLAALPWLLLLGAWAFWACRARVHLYASTSRARSEVTRMVSRVVSERSGRIVRLDCTLGEHVTAGAVLVELDAALERPQLARAQSELDSLAAQLSAIDAQITVERARRSARARMDELARARADVGLEQARAAALQKQELAHITDGLTEAQLSSRVEQLQAESALLLSQIEVGGASVAVEHVRAVHDYEDKTHLARIAELERQRAGVEAERGVKLAELQAAELAIRRARIVAPVGGKLGSVAEQQVGDVLQAGDVVATLIPEDGMQIVAEFEPSHAVGRIVPGQLAQIRFEAFSWTQFGLADARVRSVASEPRDGRIRVELQLAPNTAQRIPLQHGLAGSVDVVVDTVSPLELGLRSIGTLLSPPALAAGSSPAEPAP